MPTPYDVFSEIAARHGGVDPDDEQAVQRWYTDTLPGLPRRTIEGVLDELLSRQHGGATSHRKRSFPVGAPIPTTDASPPARLPWLTRLWLSLFFRRRP